MEKEKNKYKEIILQLKEDYKNDETKLNEFREKFKNEREELTKQMNEFNEEISKLNETKKK